MNSIRFIEKMTRFMKNKLIFLTFAKCMMDTFLLGVYTDTTN